MADRKNVRSVSDVVAQGAGYLPGFDDYATYLQTGRFPSVGPVRAPVSAPRQRTRADRAADVPAGAPVNPRIAEAEKFRGNLLGFADRVAGVPTALLSNALGVGADTLGAGAALFGLDKISASLEQTSDRLYNQAKIAEAEGMVDAFPISGRYSRDQTGQDTVDFDKWYAENGRSATAATPAREAVKPAPASPNRQGPTQATADAAAALQQQQDAIASNMLASLKAMPRASFYEFMDTVEPPAPPDVMDQVALELQAKNTAMYEAERAAAGDDDAAIRAAKNAYYSRLVEILARGGQNPYQRALLAPPE